MFITPQLSVNHLQWLFVIDTPDHDGWPHIHLGNVALSAGRLLHAANTNHSHRLFWLQPPRYNYMGLKSTC